MLRVLIVDDSAVARTLLSHVLRGAGLDVVGEARDGEEAVRMAATLRPSVIAMDVHMPGLDGHEATRRIMEEAPTPIVMVTSAQPVDVARSFRAVEAGALTLLEKPGAPGSPRFAELADELITTVKLLADVKLVRRRRRRASVPRSHVRLPERRTDLVAIGSSTGGPAALASLLKGLPPDLPVPVLIVQHIAQGFDRGLVEWLDKVTRLSVRLAEAGSPLRPGEVLVGPQDRHLGVVGNGTAELSAAPAIGGHRPSATHLFSSVARSYGDRAMGVILTGMGNDGAVGLLDLRTAGGVTVAQDKASSVVYGMPREAVHLGAVDCILPLQEIAPAIARACRRP